MINKIAKFIGILIIISYNFLSLEYFLYSVYSTRIFYFAYFAFLAIVVLITNLLYRLNLFNKFTSTLIVFLSIGLGLLTLRYILL